MADVSPLAWDQGPIGVQTAYRTVDGHSAGFEFELTATYPSAIVLLVRGRRFCELIRVSFLHARYDMAAVKAAIEALRPTLTQPDGDEWPSVEELRAWFDRRTGRVRRCRFVHEFEDGASDDAVCYCQKITRGLYEDRVRREEAPTL